MQAIRASIARGIPVGSYINACDNSGAKIVKVFTVIGLKTVKGRKPSAGIADLIMVSVKKGRPDMRKQTAYAVVVRQKKEYRRPDGVRIKFADNACVILKDEKGNPKGTIFKGPIAKEACHRWPAVSKLSKIIV